MPFSRLTSTPNKQGHGEVDETPELPCAKQTDESKPPLHCTICKYRTKSGGNLFRHRKAIHENSYGSCDMCSKRFKDIYDLRQHSRSVHMNIKMLCEICAKGFNNRHTLQRHKLMNHFDKPRYVCRICGKKFYEKSSYHGHINKHVNARPFGCTICNNFFGYKFCLVRHSLTCSNQNVDKYKCTICDKQLKSQACLKEHTKGVHGPKNKVCLCGKAFSWEHSYSRHKKTCKVAKAN